jgi:hypothetical protein
LRLCLVFAASSAPAQNLAPEQARLANVSQDFAAAMAKGEAACPRLSSRARRSAYQFEHADEFSFSSRLRRDGQQIWREHAFDPNTFHL